MNGRKKSKNYLHKEDNHMNATGQQVANEAKKLKPGIFGLGTIPYVLGSEDPIKGLDCQGLVEYCHRQCGMQMSYKGTNDMWRHMLSEKGTIAEGVQRHGSIPIGALIFICDYGAVPNGYMDTPDCEHVYIKTANGELVHASASNGKVTTRDFADKAIPNGGPTHYGLVEGVVYDGVAVEEPVAEEAAPVETTNKWNPYNSRYTYKPGKAGAGVRDIQTGLNKLGYGLNVDGDFGPLTEAAVIQFQKDHDLEVDGVAGPATWKALIDAVNAGTE